MESYQERNVWIEWNEMQELRVRLRSKADKLFLGLKNLVDAGETPKNIFEVDLSLFANCCN
jgi:hypothetical protein